MYLLKMIPGGIVTEMYVMDKLKGVSELKLSFGRSNRINLCLIGFVGSNYLA